MKYDPYWPFYSLDVAAGSRLYGFGPALVPVGVAAPLLSLAEARLHLKLDPLPVNEETGALLADVDVEPHPDDALVIALCRAVQADVDGWSGFLGRGVAVQTWQLIFSGFPSAVPLPLPPIQAVTGVEFQGLDGEFSDVAETVWRVSREGPNSWVLRTRPGQVWPDLPAYPEQVRDAVRVTFTAGYEPGHPELELIKAYAKLKLGTLYENREGVVVGTSATPMPWVDNMLDNVRVSLPDFLRSC